MTTAPAESKGDDERSSDRDPPSEGASEGGGGGGNEGASSSRPARAAASSRDGVVVSDGGGPKNPSGEPLEGDARSTPTAGAGSAEAPAEAEASGDAPRSAAPPPDDGAIAVGPVGGRPGPGPTDPRRRVRDGRGVTFRELPTTTAKAALPQNDSDKKRRKKVRVSLLHSSDHASILRAAMAHVHGDRDALLSSLLRCCGFLKEAPSFFRVVEPKIATREHLERFHRRHYLDLLEYPPPRDSRGDRGDGGGGGGGLFRRPEGGPLSPDPHSGYVKTEAAVDAASQKLLDSFGLTDDCPLPPTPRGKRDLWSYCRSVAGASLHASNLLASDVADVAMHWGGGRHHARPDCAGGFCYVNDVVLAVKQFLRKSSSSSGGDDIRRRRQTTKVLCLDVDVHHSDGVQEAFYDTDEVFTASFHRCSPGFYPDTGSPSERGKHGTPGVGHNLNVPLPEKCSDVDFLRTYDLALRKLVDVCDPDCVVLCVGADGVKGDPVATENDGGWSLSPEGLAECVRITTLLCSGNAVVEGGGGALSTTRPTRRRRRKLLLLGGGGYRPAIAARTYLLCTAAACEGSRPGLLRNELPRDVPNHEHFPRYGPEFRLVSEGTVLDRNVVDEERRTDGTKGEVGIEEATTDGDEPRSGAKNRDAEYRDALESAKKEIERAFLYLESKREEEEEASRVDATCKFDEDDVGCVGWGRAGTTTTSIVRPGPKRRNGDSAVVVVVGDGKENVGNDGTDGKDVTTIASKAVPQPHRRRRKRRRVVVARSAAVP